ncbi:MAG: YcxB family protein, partial [Methylococcaceae bacterium]|nr:YcxB family protein [Methylococcaceae bacterium]
MGAGQAALSDIIPISLPSLPARRRIDGNRMHWEFSFTPTEQEQRQALCRPQLCQPRTAGGAWRGTWWLAGALLAVLLLVLREIESAAIGRPGVFLLLGAFALPWLAALRWGRSASRAMLAADPAYRQGLRRLRFDDHGICLTWSLGELRLDWNAVTGLESRGEFYLLHAGTQRLLVPRRVFQHEDECRAWLDFVRCRLIKSPPPARAGWRLELPARVLLATWLSVAANLRAGIRLALFGRLSATALRPLPQALLGLIVVWLALHGLADFAEVGPAGRFSPTGLAELLYPLGLMLPAALAAVAISRKAESLLPALTVLLATVTPIAAVNLGLGQRTRQTLEPPVDPAIYPEFLFPFWFTLAAAVGLGRLYRLGPWRGMALSALMTGLLGLPLVLAPRENLVWVSQPSTGDYDSKYDALTAEDAFYQQPRLLARALDGLKPQRSGLTDLYFIGVGGDAEQSVFLKEVRAVEALMARRFGTDGRSIALVNSYRAAMDYP